MKSACARSTSSPRKTLTTSNPVPFGALIVHTKTGERLMRAVNTTRKDNDPSSHGETHTVRLACKKLKKPNLSGYTMYSTCEPCPMCMANALWAGLDRVVYGATIADANRWVPQIHIDAKEVARRSDLHCIVDGPGDARSLHHAFHASQYAEGVQNVVDAEEEIEALKGFQRRIFATLISRQFL